LCSLNSLLEIVFKKILTGLKNRSPSPNELAVVCTAPKSSGNPVVAKLKNASPRLSVVAAPKKSTKPGVVISLKKSPKGFAVVNALIWSISCFMRGG
jgi:hypothetical protein